MRAFDVRDMLTLIEPSQTLPVIAESVMGGGIQAVVASSKPLVPKLSLLPHLTSLADHVLIPLAVLVIIFAEIIPQTVCSRFGLQIGAAMVPFVRVIIYVFFVVAWPVAKLLEFLLDQGSGGVEIRGGRHSCRACSKIVYRKIPAAAETLIESTRSVVGIVHL